MSEEISDVQRVDFLEFTGSAIGLEYGISDRMWVVSSPVLSALNLDRGRYSFKHCTVRGAIDRAIAYYRTGVL